VFPYLYIEYSQRLRQRFGSYDAFCVALKSGIDAALVAGRDAPPAAAAAEGNDGDAASQDGDRAQKRRRTQPSASAVVKLSVVELVPFFGYYKDARPFVRITLSNPAVVRRVAASLLSGAVLGVPAQPFESHIPFLLQVCAIIVRAPRGTSARADGGGALSLCTQFFVDYNVFGMGYLRLTSALVRWCCERECCPFDVCLTTMLLLPARRGFLCQAACARRLTAARCNPAASRPAAAAIHL
jgi:hypothetical protein